VREEKKIKAELKEYIYPGKPEETPKDI